ncbi:hypothetical protein DL769_009588 [Monosporascus sp. CRB-8-3]|nr:hypothetical protein DL769_009588 [Monosporascus sp. CRB-8-3]
MKTDNYLNLCLEQAELSPLGHRHGCIVVKGGKVIGKGFNDYRPGFDGGALKTGVLPSKSFALDKQELKSKTKKGFKHFEAVFTGARPGRPVLSMHSEMMAINSALSSSSTLAATSLSRFKPSLAPSRDSKRKRQLRRDILTAYTQSVDFTTAVPQDNITRLNIKTFIIITFIKIREGSKGITGISSNRSTLGINI